MNSRCSRAMSFEATSLLQEAHMPFSESIIKVSDIVTHAAFELRNMDQKNSRNIKTRSHFTISFKSSSSIE
eukprot:scaffold17428_cov45-Prasinocladus_malaysianus.AAC.1